MQATLTLQCPVKFKMGLHTHARPVNKHVCMPALKLVHPA